MNIVIFTWLCVKKIKGVQMKLKDFIDYKKMWEAIKENTDIVMFGNSEVIKGVENGIL